MRNSYQSIRQDGTAKREGAEMRNVGSAAVEHRSTRTKYSNLTRSEKIDLNKLLEDIYHRYTHSFVRYTQQSYNGF